MELKGKKIVFLGDSITEGVGVPSVDYVYWNLVGQRSGAEVYGYGIGGTRIAPNHLPGYDDYIDSNWFGTRVEQMIPDADVVVVFGGTNDFGHGDAPMGTMKDRTEDTFCGACHVLMQKLINRYPNARLVVMTPLHRIGEEMMPFNEAGVRRAGVLRDYVNVIRQVAEFYSAPVVDLFAQSGLQPRVQILKERYMPDGLHPNQDGHIRIADCLLSVLESM